MNDKEEILAAIAANQKSIDDLAAAMAADFSKTEVRFQKMEDRQLFLERKIDNRFDLLERMMTENRIQDAIANQELGVRLTKLKTAGA